MLIGIRAIVASFVGYGLWTNKQHSDELEIISQRRQEMNQLVKKYNQKVYNLHDQANSSSMYGLVKRDYHASVASLKARWKNEDATKKKSLARIWKWIFAIGAVVILFGGCYGIGVETESGQANHITSLMEKRSWNAENIPMPHMYDHSLYVCNPDSILSEEVVDSINRTLGRLDDILGIESVMVIIGHIDNDDPVAMVRGIYDKYKVGRNDRGLVIVVGYLDHSYFIAPGRSLEADLTDLETNHLAQEYLIPSMKAEKPDSGML